MTFKKIVLILAISAIPSIANAQATPTSRFVWDQIAPDLATANSYRYKYYPDAVTTGAFFNTVNCTGTASPFTCAAPIPAFTPGSHTIQLTASYTNNTGESAKSPVFTFTFIVIPAVPANIRLGDD